MRNGEWVLECGVSDAAGRRQNRPTPGAGALPISQSTVHSPRTAGPHSDAAHTGVPAGPGSRPARCACLVGSGSRKPRQQARTKEIAVARQTRCPVDT